MSDPLRTDTPRTREAKTAGHDRAATIERLLLAGLDHYFAGQYQQAVNVWTRVLFLDRAHQRARAYIDRARSALAERQRESEELLQNGMAAFQRGEGQKARRLLHDALDRGAPHDEALAVLHRLDRLQLGRQAGEADAAAGGGAGEDRVGRSFQARRGWAAAGAAALLVAAVLVGQPWPDWQPVIPLRAPAALPAPAPDPMLALPTRAQRALDRGLALASTGHLHDALAALEQVRPTDTQQAQADRLRAHIQRQLLALALGTPVESGLPDSLP
jgi:hypothetical protein